MPSKTRAKRGKGRTLKAPPRVARKAPATLPSAPHEAPKKAAGSLVAIAQSVASLAPKGRVTGTPASSPSAEIMTADEVAAFLRVNRKTVYEAADRGALPCGRLGRRILFSRSAVLRWLEQRR